MPPEQCLVHYITRSLKTHYITLPILDANKSFDTCITSAKNTINTLHNACLAASGILGLAVKHALPVILGTLACNEAKDYDLEHVSDDDGTCATTRGEDRKDCE